MAVPENDPQAGEDPDARFVEHSHLSYLIPHETDLSLEDAFKGADTSVPLLDSIPRRKSLFFGMASPMSPAGMKLTLRRRDRRRPPCAKDTLGR